MESKDLCSAGCGRTSERVCMICGIQPYCSRRCQIEHWTMHQEGCHSRYPQHDVIDATVQRASRRGRSSSSLDESSTSVLSVNTRSSFDEYLLRNASEAPSSMPQLTKHQGDNIEAATSSERDEWDDKIDELSALIKADRFKEAVKVGRAIVDGSAAYGVSSSSQRLVPALISLGLATLNLGDAKSAEDCYNRAIARGAEEDPGVATWLVSLLLAQGRVQEAEACCADHLAAAEDTLGERHASTLSLLRQRGEILVRREQMTEACEVFERCYALSREDKDVADPELQDLARDLIVALLVTQQLGRAHEVAADNYTALLVVSEAGVDVRADLALSGLKLAQIKLGMQSGLDEAYVLLDAALGATAEAFGASSLQTAEVLVTMAQVRKKRGQFDEDTVDILNRAHECFELNEGPDAPNTRFTLKSIQRVRKEQYKSKFVNKATS